MYKLGEKDNEFFCKLMWNMGIKVLKDRPMLPNTKMTGGDLPVWDDDYVDKASTGKILPGVDLNKNAQQIKDYWLTCGNAVNNISEYKSSDDQSSTLCCGKIDI